jgi:hypothetical protein
LPSAGVAESDTVDVVCREIPAPIMNMLRQRFPRLLHGLIADNGDDVYLILPDRRGQPEAVRYRAGDDFKTAVRVADSGLGNLRTLCTGGFPMTLLPIPPEDRA